MLLLNYGFMDTLQLRADQAVQFREPIEKIFLKFDDF